jgi:hypothetical protein
MHDDTTSPEKETAKLSLILHPTRQFCDDTP